MVNHKNRLIGIAAAVLFSGVAHAAPVTIISENFEGYTSFPTQNPYLDYVNAGIPKISEGAAAVWYGARFEVGNGTIDSDLAVQKVGGGTNPTHVGRFEDDAGLLLKIGTTGLNNVTLSFDWRTFLAETTDRLVVGYHVGPISGFGPCTGNGEAGCFADLRASSGTPLPWFTTETGSTLTGNWTQLLRASASNSWNSQTYTLSGAANQSEVWIAFWLDNGEGDFGKIDNVTVTATVVPIPAAVWLLGSGLFGLGAFVRRRRH